MKNFLKDFLYVCLAFCVYCHTLYATSNQPFLDPSEPIDYSELNLKYYPYIIAYHATTDKEIATLINSLEASSSKTGIFIGIYGGWAFSNATNDPNYTSTNAFAYGAKVGYQSFFPSLYDRLVIPNVVGSRIYLQYLGSNTKELSFSDYRLSGIGVSADILVDMPITRNFQSGAIMGLGLLSLVYDKSPNSSLGGLINLGFDFVLQKRHRIELEVKIIINNNLDWFGAIPMTGYSYVF
ncbi:membrane protein [Helicobacter fennelliae]|uniref:Membrane protein n=1 Tax=Helicobacter fennelliae TaxID=215 RepID=A0A2X3DGS0_9HELI|nr:hypothetical protein [Helicobacter fennelliae]SQB98609.1 membrane protein [Helicobacter fennelliae]